MIVGDGNSTISSVPWYYTSTRREPLVSTLHPEPDFDYSEDEGLKVTGISEFKTVSLGKTKFRLTKNFSIVVTILMIHVLYFPATQPLRGVPEDVKEFWGDQFIDISIITVLEKEITERLNITMDKVHECINLTTEFIERQVRIVAESDWKERGW